MVGNVNGSSSTVPTNTAIEWRVNGVLDETITGLTGHTANSLHNGDVVELKLIAQDGAVSTNTVTIPTPTFSTSALDYQTETINLNFSSVVLPNGSNSNDAVVIQISGKQSGTVIGTTTINEIRGNIAGLTNYSLDFSSYSINLENAWDLECVITENFTHNTGVAQIVRSFDVVTQNVPAPSTVIAVIDSVLP